MDTHCETTDSSRETAQHRQAIICAHDATYDGGEPEREVHAVSDGNAHQFTHKLKHRQGLRCSHLGVRDVRVLHRQGKQTAVNNSTVMLVAKPSCSTQHNNETEHGFMRC